MLAPERMTKADVAAFRARYRSRPVEFCAEILGVDLDENQRAMAEAVRDHKKTAVIAFG